MISSNSIKQEFMKSNVEHRSQKSFSRILTSLIREHRTSARSIAKKANISPSTLNDWCAGAAPSDFAAVKRLADTLNVSFSFLLTGQHDDHSKPFATVTEAFEDGGQLFDGYCKITIQRLVPRKNKKELS